MELVFLVLAFVFTVLSGAHRGSASTQTGFSPPAYRFSEQLFHRKEDSPVFCSRAVSRWVLRSWTTVLEGALEHEISSPELGRHCPFSSSPFTQQKNSMYAEQEAWKSLRHRDNTFGCLKCLKVFKSEYYIDRHLDRRHSFATFQLPDDYRGGLPERGIKVATKPGNRTSVPLIASDYQRWGSCLEDYCAIFDVCDRPPDGRFAVIMNNLSVTYPQYEVSEKNAGYERLTSKDDDCSETRLREAHRECHRLIDDCFPLLSLSAVVQRTNVYMKRNLCGALETCHRYLTRRLFTSTNKHYTEAAFLGALERPLSAVTAWRLFFVVLLSVFSIVAVTALFCCFVEHMEGKSPRNVRFEHGEKARPRSTFSSHHSATDRAFHCHRVPLQTSKDVLRSRSRPGIAFPATSPRYTESVSADLR